MSRITISGLLKDCYTDNLPSGCLLAAHGPRAYFFDVRVSLMPFCPCRGLFCVVSGVLANFVLLIFAHNRIFLLLIYFLAFFTNAFCYVFSWLCSSSDLICTRFHIVFFCNMVFFSVRLFLSRSAFVESISVPD